MIMGDSAGKGTNDHGYPSRIQCRWGARTVASHASSRPRVSNAIWRGTYFTVGTITAPRDPLDPDAHLGLLSSWTFRVPYPHGIDTTYMTTYLDSVYVTWKMSCPH
jgi:hypothetical protein